MGVGVGKENPVGDTLPAGLGVLSVSMGDVRGECVRRQVVLTHEDLSTWQLGVRGRA